MWLTLTFKVKFNIKVKICPILILWVCLRDKSPLIEVRISKIGPKMHPNTVKVPNDFGIDWPRSSILLLVSKQLFFSKLCVSYSFASFCIYLVRPSPVSVPHPTWLCTYTDSYECGQGPTMDHETVYLYILVRPLEFSQPQLGNWHWILQAAIGLRYIIYTSHVEILYANINQSLKQQ